MKETKQTPFFKRFLENSEDVDMAKASGGYRDYTLKWPSDSDECP